MTAMIDRYHAVVRCELVEELKPIQATRGHPSMQQHNGLRTRRTCNLTDPGAAAAFEVHVTTARKMRMQRCVRKTRRCRGHYIPIDGSVGNL